MNSVNKIVETDHSDYIKEKSQNPLNKGMYSVRKDKEAYRSLEDNFWPVNFFVGEESQKRLVEPSGSD